MLIGRTDAEAETAILWPSDVKKWLWRQEVKGKTEDEMVGWHRQLDAHEFEQALGVGDGQRSLVLQSVVLQRVRHDWATELNWTDQLLSIRITYLIVRCAWYFSILLVAPPICVLYFIFTECMWRQESCLSYVSRSTTFKVHIFVQIWFYKAHRPMASFSSYQYTNWI